MSTYTLVDDNGESIPKGTDIVSRRTGNVARFTGFGPLSGDRLPLLLVTWLDEGDSGFHAAKQFGLSVLRSAGPCWTDTCVAPDCDDENHVDATGSTWRQAENEQHCPRHEIYDVCHGYSEGTREAEGRDFPELRKGRGVT